MSEKKRSRLSRTPKTDIWRRWKAGSREGRPLAYCNYRGSRCCWSIVNFLKKDKANKFQAMNADQYLRVIEYIYTAGRTDCPIVTPCKLT